MHGIHEFEKFDESCMTVVREESIFYGCLYHNNGVAVDLMPI